MKSALYRLFSWLVITSFLWSTLYPTLVFAEFIRQTPEPVVFEEGDDHQPYAHFKLNIQNLDESALDSSFKEGDLSRDSSLKPCPFRIPLGRTLEETQSLIDRDFVGSLYQNLKIVEEGFTWTAYGVDFYWHNCGDLLVSKSLTALYASDNLHLTNLHGSIRFKDNFTFKHLTLTTKDVVQEETATVTVDTLNPQVAGIYENNGFFTVSKLYFDGVELDSASLLTHPQFVNNGSCFWQEDSDVRGSGAFVNAGNFSSAGALSLFNATFTNAKTGVFLTKGPTIFGVTESLSNAGGMVIYSDLSFKGHFKVTNTGGAGFTLPGFEAEKGLATSAAAKMEANSDGKPLQSAAHQSRGGQAAPFVKPVTDAFAKSGDDSGVSAFFSALLAPALSSLSSLYSLASPASPEIPLARDHVVRALKEKTSDIEIRRYVREEIIQLVEKGQADRLPQGRETQALLKPLYEALMAAVQKANDSLGTEDLSVYELLDQDSERKNGDIEQAFLALERYERPLEAIKRWALEPETYEGFVDSYVSQSEYRLEPRPLKERVKKHQKGVLDALAHLYDINILIYGEVSCHPHSGTRHLLYRFPETLYSDHFQETEEQRTTPENGHEREQAAASNPSLSFLQTVVEARGIPERHYVLLEASEDTDVAGHKASEPSGEKGEDRNVDRSGDKSQDRTRNRAKNKEGDKSRDEDATGFWGKGTILFDNFRGEIDNTGIFTGSQTLQGHLATLTNAGTFGANQGFQNLSIDQVTNTQTGRILGDGSLTLGKAENEGLIQSSHLQVTITESLTNNEKGLLAIDQLYTSGSGIFEHHGDIEASSVVLNNAHFVNYAQMDQPHLDLVMGDRVTTFLNHTEARLKTKSLTLAEGVALEATSVNRGAIEADHFTNAARSFVNRDSIDVKTWTHSGKSFQNKAGATLDVEARTVFKKAGTLENEGECTLGPVEGTIETLINKGGVNMSGVTTLHVETLTNTKNIISQAEMTITGQTAHNSGTLKSVKGLSYKGQSLISTPVSKLEGEHIILETTTPLVLQGNIAAGKGAVFAGPTIDQQASMSVTSGKAEFRGQALANSGDIDVDALVYEGKTLTNTGTLEADSYDRKSILEKVTTSGTLTVRQGNLYAKSIQNSGTAHLKGGLYRTEHWDNKGGKAEIDRFSIRSKTLSLEGELDVAQFVPFREYEQVDVLGKTIIRSGELQTQSLTNENTLSFSEGVYDLGKVKNKTATSKIEIPEGAKITVAALDGQGGEIKTFVPCVLDFSLSDVILSGEVKTILATHDQRCATFTALPTVLEALEKEEQAKNRKVYEQTHSIADQLKNGKINTKRHATAAEMEAVLKALMAAELTKHIHTPDQQEALNLSSNPILDTTDPRYSHFETLRLSEKLARFLTKLVTERGYEALNDGYGDGTEDHATLCKYTGLKGDLFLLWFRDVFDQHKAGFVPAKTPSLPDLLTAAAKPSSQTQAKSEIQKIFEHHTQRCTTFNTLAAAGGGGTEGDVKKEGIYKNTHAIAEALKDKDKLNTKKRLATNSEREVMLKAVMAAEITNHIHNPARQATLDLSSQFPELQETDFLFGHFEVLRLTEKLSRTLLKQIAERGYDVLNHAFGCLYDVLKLCCYTGLQQEMFLIWFKEVFEAHKAGFPEPKIAYLKVYPSTDSHNPAEASPQTPTAPSSTPSFKSFNLGTLKAAKDVILKSPDAAWLAALLQSNALQLDKDATLVIESDWYSSQADLVLPYPVHFVTRGTLNRHKLTTRGITLQSLVLKNGIDNDHMATIHSYGPMRVETGKGGVDNRFGIIEGTKGGCIQSLGPILNGFAQEQEEITFINCPLRTRTLTNYPFVEQRKKRNGAQILTFGSLSVESQDNIVNDFGALSGARSGDTLDSVSVKTAKKLSNKTGIISAQSQAPIYLEAAVLENLIGEKQEGEPEESDNEKHGVRAHCAGRKRYTQSASSDGSSTYKDPEVEIVDRIYYDSDPGSIQSLGGDIYLKVRSGLNKGSYILSPKGIFINGKKLEEGQSFPSEFEHTTEKSVTNFFNGPFIKPKLGIVWREVEGSVQMHGALWGGEFVHVETGLLKISGAINAPTVTVNADALKARGISARRHRQTGNFIIDMGHAARKQVANNPLFEVSAERGIQVKSALRPASASVFNPQHNFSLNPQGSARFYLGPQVLDHVMLYVLGDLLGTLNVFGKSGYSLLQDLHARGIRAEQKLIKAGHTPTNSLATREAISSFEEGFIFYETQVRDGQEFQVPMFYFTEAMVIKAAVAVATSVTGNKIDININGNTSLDEAMFAAYKPYEDPDHSTTNSGLPAQQTPQRQTPSSQASHNPQNADDCHLSIKAQGVLDGLGTGFSCDGPTHLFGKKGVELKSKVKKEQTSHGFQTHQIDLSIESKGPILVESEAEMLLRGIRAQSDISIRMKAAGNIYDHALALEYAQSRYENHKDGSLYVEEKGINQSPSTYAAPESVVFESMSGRVESYAPQIKSALIQFIAANGTAIHDVHDFYIKTTQQDVSGGSGPLAKDKQIRTQYYSEKSRGATFDGALYIKTTQGNVSLTNITACDVTIEAINGVVEFKQGINIDQYARSEQMQSLLWQSQQAYQAKHQTYSASNITGKIKVISRETIVEVVKNQTIEFLNRIEQDGGVITQAFLEEIHDVQSQKVEGPTAAFSAVIALAATLATAGSAGPGVMAAMQAAAVGSLAGQAAVHLVACQGDIGKAAQRLASTDTFKNIAVAVATAGITKALAGHLNISTAPDCLGGHAQYQGLKAGVDAGIGLAVDGEISLDHLGRGFAAGVIGGHLANQIGTAYGQTHIDGMTHKITHAALGAFTGAILDEKGDLMAGAAAGALGAFVAETFADMFKPEKPTIEKLTQKTHSSGRPLTKDEFTAFYQEEMNTYNAGVGRTKDFAKLTAATTALFANQDVPIAIATGTNAVDNNFIFLAVAGITIATTAYEAYDIYQTYKNEGPEAALIKLGVNATLFVVGGLAVKRSAILVRAATAEILARNPLLEKALGTFVETLLVNAEKVMATNAGQKIAAGVEKMEAPLRKAYDKGSEAFNRMRTKVGGKSVTAEAESTINVHASKPRVPAELRPYIREVEAKSGIPVHPTQREILAKDLRENTYIKLEGEALKKHQKPYNNTKLKADLKTEWSRQTGQEWPKYPNIDPKTGIQKLDKFGRPEFKDYQAHHINPQQLGGKHEWWNMHPVHPHMHQGGVHGAGSQLNKILKEVEKDAK